jgi:hypothetical protein
MRATFPANLVFHDYNTLILVNASARGSVVAKALCCKPEGRWFDIRLGDFFKFA